MQSLTRSLSSSSPLRVPGLIARVLRLFTRHTEVEQRPAIRWVTDFRPIDWEGEDTSLTQEQLEVLR